MDQSYVRKTVEYSRNFPVLRCELPSRKRQSFAKYTLGICEVPLIDEHFAQLVERRRAGRRLPGQFAVERDRGLERPARSIEHAQRAITVAGFEQRFRLHIRSSG